jgi:putative phosphoesterase
MPDYRYHCPMNDTASPLRIGLISDTHDLLRPQARHALAGVAHILHAGDICADYVLADLAGIAPVTAVRGNNDRGAWARGLQATALVEIGGVFLYMVHDLAELDIDPRAAGVQAVIYGHSHRPRIEERAGVLYVNPGSAGPRRFTLPVSVGFLEIAAGSVTARLQTLQI